MPEHADTSFVKNILGVPIDMGFDYRYLIDSVGPNWLCNRRSISYWGGWQKLTRNG